MSAALQQKPQEPSMEEILASIRKIIADDTGDAATAAKPVAPPLAVVPPQPKAETKPVAFTHEDDDILDLPPSARKVAPDLLSDDPVPLDLHFADEAPVIVAPVILPPPVAEPVVVPPPPEPVQVAPPPPEPAPVFLPPPPANEQAKLMSDQTDEAARLAFGTLANTVLGGQSRSIDDVVREMLKPMIRTWLDDNLPTMVERLVKAEIERVARGGR
jgi:uncharacterized protein